MKKTLLLSILFFNFSFSQTIALDNNFGTNGITNIQLTDGESDYLKIINFNNTSILAFSKVYNASTVENIIYKLNLDGTINTSITLPNYKGDFDVIVQGSDKFIVAFEYVNTIGTSNNERAFIRFNSIGVVDPTFGTNGEFRVNYISDSSKDKNLLILADNSLLFKDSERFIKYTVNGLIDTSYGTNGFVFQNSSPSILDSNDGNLLLQYSTKLDKINSVGNPVTTFATNGTFTYPSQSDYYSKVTNTGNIYTIGEGNLPVSLYYLNSNGSLVPSFNTSGILDISTSNGNLLYAEDVIFDDNKFFIVGETVDTKPYIRCYSNTGNVISLNTQDFYKENSITNGFYSSVMILNGDLYTGGDYYDSVLNKWHFAIAKYNFQNLGVSENDILENKIVVENPVKEKLNINSDIQIKAISIYTIEGKLVSEELTNSSDISFLSGGIYILKIDFLEVNKSEYFKIIKE